ncbi:phage tail-collar fiber domain-containing protein [Stutzerimonas nitrititolerans]|uniref:phage tail-collar fiber domain-containing protein n=1 Tax=Stutzerimonas nitrititolerans TaxID=2482751 RepID=UPI0028A2C351|nr:phage tail protein [Stutzerimonas nitrititolerans]
MADHNSQYMAILTAVGEAKLANATALGVPWNISHLGVGDANGAEPLPSRTQTALLNERRRAPLNQLSIDPNNPAIVIAEQVIPEDVGGWWIREIGLYDEAGDLVAVANCPPTYKPELAQGSGRTQVVRLNLLVSSTQNIQLKIDPSVVLATRAYADSLIVNHLAAIDPHPEYTTEADVKNLVADESFLAPAVRNLARGSTTQDPNAAVHPVILTVHPNAPLVGLNWYITTTFYSSISPTANRGQIAVSYQSTTTQVFARSFYNGVWTKWARCDGSEDAPPGLIGYFAGNARPAGWLKATGAVVSRTTYAALFEAIGTTYGTGDGSTTFRLPDLRGEFIRGADEGRGVDAARILGTWQADEIKSHDHRYPSANVSAGQYQNTVDAVAVSGLQPVCGTDTGSTSDNGFARYLDDATATGGLETRPRNIALQACIKY